MLFLEKKVVGFFEIKLQFTEIVVSVIWNKNCIILRLFNNKKCKKYHVYEKEYQCESERSN